jgi:hypothetical protein
MADHDAEDERRACHPESKCIWKMPREQISEFMEAIAERGANKALARVGLGDESAASDMMEIRNWVSSARVAKRALWAQIWRIAAMIIVGYTFATFVKHPSAEEVSKWLGH